MNEHKFSFKIKRGQKWESRNIHFPCYPLLFQKPFPFPITPFFCLAPFFSTRYTFKSNSQFRGQPALWGYLLKTRGEPLWVVIWYKIIQTAFLFASCALNVKRNGYTRTLVVEWQRLRLKFPDMWPFLKHPEMFSDDSQAHALWVICAFWEWVRL